MHLICSLFTFLVNASNGHSSKLDSVARYYNTVSCGLSVSTVNTQASVTTIVHIFCLQKNTHLTDAKDQAAEKHKNKMVSANEINLLSEIY